MSRTLKRLLLSIGTGSAGARFLKIDLALTRAGVQSKTMTRASNRQLLVDKHRSAG
jgi:hypothetical protein